MKYLAFALTTLLSTHAFSDTVPEIQSIDDLLWKNRIILIWSDDEARFRKAMEDTKDDVQDRDIVWFIINGNDVSSNYPGNIAANFAHDTTEKYADEEKKVLLIGKDGGIKNENSQFYLEDLLKQIDTMPMRKNEMKAKSD